MSLFSKLESRIPESLIKKLQPFLILIFLILASSCGFSPVYSQKSENKEVVDKLASVEVKPIQSILGQQYVTALEDALNPGHSSIVKEYVIETQLRKDVQALAIERDRTVTRFKVMIIVEYKLKELSSGKILSQGTIRGGSDYDRVNSDYATYVSENETASRAIRELAQDTRVRIISALVK